MDRGRLCLVIVCITILALTACGGGGGGEGGGGGQSDPPALAGSYRVGSLAGFAPIGPARTVETTFGTLQTGGGNTLDLSLYFNQNGHVYGGTVISDNTYTLAGSGALIWETPSGFGPVAWLGGGISRGGGVAILGSILTGTYPQVTLLVRPRGDYSASGMAATWHTVEWGYDPFSQQESSGVGDTVLGADLTWSSSIRTYTQSGFSDGGSLGTCDLWADGAILMRSGGTTWGGGILEGAQVAMVCGANEENGHPALRVLVREATGTSTSTLSGNYWVVAFQYDVSRYRSGTGTANADGAGQLFLALDWNDQTNFMTGGLGLGATYSVDAVGNLGMTVVTGNEYRGAVTGSGAFAVLGGGTNTGAPQSVWIFVRQ